MMIIIIVCLFRVLGSGSVFGFRTWSVGCKVCLFFPTLLFFFAFTPVKINCVLSCSCTAVFPSRMNIPTRRSVYRVVLNMEY